MREPRTVVILALLAVIPLWLMGWPTSPGPYSFSAGYALPLVLLGAVLAAALSSYGSRIRLRDAARRHARACLLVLSGSLALLAAEATVRRLGSAEWGGGEGPLQPSWGFRGYELNSRGSRGPEVGPEELKGKLVVLGLGDSVLFGMGVRWEDTFLQRLEQKLDERLPVRVRAVNASFPGVGTANEEHYLRHYAADEYRPHVLLLQFTLNDPELDLYRLRPLTGWGGEKRTLWRSHLFFLFARTVAAIRDPYRGHILSLYREDSPDWLACQKALQNIRALCRRRKIVPLLAIYPLFEDFSAYPYRLCHEKVTAAAGRLGYRVIDLLGEFQGQPEPAERLRVSRGDPHPNARAHELAAEAVARRLRADWKAIEKELRSRLPPRPGT